MLAVQYYRPPSPDRSHWGGDLATIADAGFDAIQLWLVWGWIEPEPGRFEFDDYDELIELAEANGLKVILSTIAELHPFWLPRMVPEAVMVDHLGRSQVSSLRGDSIAGLSPGCCRDHGEVEARMMGFLRACAERYGSRESVIAWDCWNETRWAVEGDGYLCHCPASTERFRDWLRDQYGDLAGLNKAWKRRYSNWADVQPGKKPGLPYTDTMEHQRFLTDRATEHLTLRRDTLRAAGTHAPILAHAGAPGVGFKGFDFEQALARGNDFALAPVLDGYGCSHFPVGHGLGDHDFGWAVEGTASAVPAGGKVWVSELQGGSARHGIEVQAPVTPTDQQRWIWSAIGRGVERVVFWEWRDEIYGRESGGYGLNGSDGYAQARLTAIRESTEVITQNRQLLDSYRPEQPRWIVVFEADGLRYDWAQYGADATDGHLSTIGWLRALERSNIPYAIRDSENVWGLESASVVSIAWPLLIKPGLVDRLAEWVHGGGHLLVEADLASVDRQGFIADVVARSARSPFPVEFLGRRPVSDAFVEVPAPDGDIHVLESGAWQEEMRVGGKSTRAASVSHGAGTVTFMGTMVGLASSARGTQGLADYASAVAGFAGATSGIVRVDGESNDALQWRAGRSGRDVLVFVTGRPEATALITPMALSTPTALIGTVNVSGSSITARLSRHGVAVLRLTAD